MNKDKMNTLADQIIEFVKNDKDDFDAYKITGLLDDLKRLVLAKLYEGKEGLFVIKRRGGVEAFDEVKLANNLAKASDDAKTPLNESDLSILVKDVEKKAIEDHGDNLIESKDIIIFVLETLKNAGLKDMYEVYKRFNG